MTTKKDDGTSPITAYKGFDKNWKCRGYQYTVGETHVHDGKTEACESGLHSCEYPLDVLSYYSPAQLVFALVEASGDLSRKGDDSKIASSRLTVKEELGIAGLVKAAIEYTVSRTKPSKSKKMNTDDVQGAASATGGRSAASATGYKGAASATGDYAAASATGYQVAASATGDFGAASATGDFGAASATGGRSAASATGYQGAASATGYQSAASATGGRSAALATGDYAAASATGAQSVSLSAGWQGKAMASETGAIVLAYRNNSYEIVHIRASKVGENGIKPNVWYSLDENGEFVEGDA